MRTLLVAAMLAAFLAPGHTVRAETVLGKSSQCLVALPKEWTGSAAKLRKLKNFRLIFQIREAADDLARYLGEAVGAKAMVGPWREAFDGVAFHIGQTPFVRSQRLALDDLDHEGYLIETAGRNVMLVGRTDLATRHAVHAFIEKHLGVRWYWPHELGTVVPRREKLALPDLDQRSNPAFLARYFTVHGRDDSRRWERRNRLQDHWTVRLKGNSHSMAAIIPKKEYGKDHPEYYSLRKGKRFVPPSRHLERRATYCLTNPALARITADWMIDRFGRYPDAFSLSMAMNDSTWYCQCARCKAEGVVGATDGPNYADRYFGFVNRVARKVAQKYPDKYVGVMAYGGARVLPNRLKALGSNVNVYLVSGSPAYNFVPSSKERRFNLTREWGRFAGSLCVYTYQFGSANNRFYQVPTFYPHLAAEELRYCNRVGVKGQVIEMLPFWAFSPKAWITGKLLWDPSLSVDALLDDFCDNLFGPAAEDMKRYFSLLEEAWLCQRRARTLSGSDTQYALFQPFSGRMDAALRSALSRADTEKRKQRVRFFKDGIRTTQLFAKSWEISGEFSPYPTTARGALNALRWTKELHENETAIQGHREMLEEKYGLSQRMIAPRDKTYLVRETVERCAAWFGKNGFSAEAALLRSSPAIRMGKPGAEELKPGGIAAVLENEKTILARVGPEQAGSAGGARAVFVDNSEKAKASGAKLLFSESFESADRILESGASIKGHIRFEHGVHGQAAYLCSKDSLVGYPLEKIGERAGTIEFFLKTRWAGREEGFTAYLVCTGGNFDPPGHLSVRGRRRKGVIELALTLYAQGVVAYCLAPVKDWKDETWNHVGAGWRVDPKKPDTNLLALYVNGKPHLTRHKISKARDVRLKAPFGVGNRPVSQRHMAYPLFVVDEFRIYDRPIPPKAFSFEPAP